MVNLLKYKRSIGRFFAILGTIVFVSGQVFALAGTPSEPGQEMASPENILASNAVFSHPLTEEGEGDFQGILLRLAGTDLLTGRFEQHRHLKVLNKALTSHGRFVFSHGQTIIWERIEPAPSTVILTRDGILKIGDEALPAEKQPSQMKVVGRMFAAMSGKDLGQLKKYFDVFFQGAPSDWTIGLVPKMSLLRKGIVGVVLSGGENVQNVVILQPKGDWSETILEVDVSPVLTDNDRPYLD